MIIQRVLSLLDEKSLKMADLCRHLGINTSTMANWKTRNTDPPTKYIIPICEFLGVDCEYLLTGKETNRNSISTEDEEWLKLIHQLPIRAQYEFRGEIKGYLKHLKEESVAADEQLQEAK